MRYKAGVIGCGRIGSEFDNDPGKEGTSTHAGAYSSMAKVELAALSDLDESRLEKAGKRWGVSHLYQDYREMLRREKLDIISICTWPPSSHAEIAMESIKYGVRAIFCEKPIADSLKNADEMIKRCREKGVVLQVDHQRRFDTLHQDVKAYIREGNLGGMQQVTFYYTRGIANTGSHVFDLLRFFFGDVDWVQAVNSRNKSPNPDDPNIDGMLKFNSGLFGSIQACDDKNYLIFELDCLGEKGRLNLKYNVLHDTVDLEFYKVSEPAQSSSYNSLISAPSPIVTGRPDESILNSVKHLIRCLEEKTASISSGEDGRAALELICAFRESADADGRKVSLPLKNSSIVIKSR